MPSLRRWTPFLGLIAAALSGCSMTSTSISSMVAPEGITTYHKVAVDFPLNSLGMRQNAEQRFQDIYEVVRRDSRSSDTVFVPSHKLMFPGRTYSQAEMDSVFTKHAVQAVLSISLGESGEDKGYVQGTTSTYCTQYTYYRCSATSSSTSGGYDYSKPWTTYTARLYDAKTHAVMWVGSGGSGGNAFSSGTDLVLSIADKTVEQLIKDGLISR